MSSDAGLAKLSDRLDKLYEFERAPVTEDKLHGGRYFAAMFAGEHVAGTEFVIGVLFVQWGANARDLILGLLLGNILAVLSWAFVCAPIATQVRLTLYWYAKQIIGPGLTVVYNLVNALLYCCLAGAMIGVSASAVGLAISKLGIPFRHPELDDVYPNSPEWVVIVLAVGAVVVVLAIAGFKRLSQFSAVCAPWMFPIFLAGALATLPGLGKFHSARDLWQLAKTAIWTGEPLKAKATVASDFRSDLDAKMLTPALRKALTADPHRTLALSAKATIHVEAPGQRWRIVDGEFTYVVKEHRGRLRFAELQSDPLGFWHILFFAWFCNLAMHIGLSDMAVFRYAKRWSYGFYSGFGMLLGHYFAWICAGVMGAVVWGEVNPGKMADTSAGMAGLICVLLAGWTTANPTIYRAGLALQIITPNWPRWKVTLLAGGITTIVAVFPAIVMKLLNFVAIYGLMLMPIGAVIVCEHWFFPRLGLRRYWAQRANRVVNPAALIAWLAVLVICFPIENFTEAVHSPMALLGVHLFFRWLPGWFISVIVYTLACYLIPAARGGPEEAKSAPASARTGAAGPGAAPAAIKMTPLLWGAGAVAALSLVACIVLALRVFMGGSVPEVYNANLASYKQWLMVATVVYFATGIYWTSRREKMREAAHIA